MKINADDLKGKGPLIVSYMATFLLIVTIISLFFYPQDGVEIVAAVEDEVEEVVEKKEPAFLYDICVDDLIVEQKKVANGESLTTILSRFGFSSRDIYDIERKSKGIFNARSIMKGAKYTTLSSKDDSVKLQYLIYNISPTKYVEYSFVDSLSISCINRKIDVKRKSLNVLISSSLWESIASAGGDPALAVHIEDIFQWTINFSGIRGGDSFSLIYNENYVDNEMIGIGDIIALSYTQKGRCKYAFLHKQGKKSAYWDENGMSLKRAFLKAPLRFSRISSKFTYRRMHPVHKVYRAHTGVDYAAPSGTPVLSMADGIVTDKFYNNGGGNTIKIKHHIHNGTYSTGYLHLRGFAKGIRKGKRVSQGEVIGYVGSTGVSTGPHLDFRIWKHGKPIDPLKFNGGSGEPLFGDEKKLYKENITPFLKEIKDINIRSNDTIAKNE